MVQVPFSSSPRDLRQMAQVRKENAEQRRSVLSLSLPACSYRTALSIQDLYQVTGSVQRQAKSTNIFGRTQHKTLLSFVVCSCRMRLANVAAKMIAAIVTTLGGASGIMGVAGTLTFDSLAQIAVALIPILAAGDIITDAGCGVGELLLKLSFLLPPLLNVALNGFDIDPAKTQKAKDVQGVLWKQVCLHTDKEVNGHAALNLPWKIEYKHSSVVGMGQLSCTMIVTFWEGWCTFDKIALGVLCQKNQNLRHAVIIQRHCRQPETLITAHKFPPMQLSSHFPVKMAGKGQQFHAYIFVRA